MVLFGLLISSGAGSYLTSAGAPDGAGSYGTRRLLVDEGDADPGGLTAVLGHIEHAGRAGAAVAVAGAAGLATAQLALVVGHADEALDALVLDLRAADV